MLEIQKTIGLPLSAQTAKSLRKDRDCRICEQADTCPDRREDPTIIGCQQLISTTTEETQWTTFIR